MQFWESIGSNRVPPLTSVITTVAYGGQRVLLQRKGSTLSEEVALSQLRQYVAQEENPGNEKQVIIADMQLPIDAQSWGRPSPRILVGLRNIAALWRVD